MGMPYEGLERWKRSVLLHLIVGAGGVMLTIPLVILDEQMQASSNLSLSQLFHMIIFSITNYCASIASLVLLECLNIISWQVANVMKRLVLIAGSVLYFKNPIHFWNVAGITVAMSGLVSYNVAKLRDRERGKGVVRSGAYKVVAEGPGAPSSASSHSSPSSSPSSSTHHHGKRRRHVAVLESRASVNQGMMERTSIVGEKV